MGVQEFEIIKKVKGDYGLVKMWLSFLLHNHYMAKEFHPDVCLIYSVTDKGKEYSLIDIVMANKTLLATFKNRRPTS
jgi:hypothetical protein